jgi:hypothetical protein
MFSLMEEDEEFSDPVSEILSPSSQKKSKKSSSPSKTETRDILERAGPTAALRLAQITEHGDDKEAVPAAQAILDRIGFGKADSSLPRAPSSILPAQALIAALLGIGKVLGVAEAQKGLLINENSSSAASVDLPSDVRALLAKPVHQLGVSGRKKTPKKPARNASGGRER